MQRELSRSTKLPEEIYNIALSYERSERAYKSYTGKSASSAPQITIEQEQKENKGVFEVEQAGDSEEIPQGQAVGAVITVDVTIATHRKILPIHKLVHLPISTILIQKLDFFQIQIVVWVGIRSFDRKQIGLIENKRVLASLSFKHCFAVIAISIYVETVIFRLIFR